MDLSQDFKPQTLYEALSRTCSFLPLSYQSNTSKSSKHISLFEKGIEECPSQVLHAVVVQRDLAPRLLGAAESLTGNVRLNPSSPYYKPFVYSMDQQLKWQFESLPPIIYSESDVQSIAESIHYGPAIKAINLLESMNNSPGVADLSLARGHPYNRPVWLSSVDKQRATPDRALYQKVDKSQGEREVYTDTVGGSSSSDLSSKSVTDEIQQGMQRLKIGRSLNQPQEEPTPPQNYKPCCTIELKVDNLLSSIALESALDPDLNSTLNPAQNPASGSALNKREEIAIPFVYSTNLTNTDDSNKKKICQVIIQVCKYKI